MTNSNLYVYLKKLFPEQKPNKIIGSVVSKEGNTLIVEDDAGRKMRVKNFTGNDYITGTRVYVSDDIIIGRVNTNTAVSVYHV